ncbi:MAG: hypothetical protein WC768_03585 [Patescibacteria group bacterium]|jgi:hypothetical protein
MKNRFLQALVRVVLFSATVHLFLLVVFSVIKKDIVTLNYFKIIGLDLFFPNIASGVGSQILSMITMLVLYSLFFIFFAKKNHKL